MIEGVADALTVVEGVTCERSTALTVLAAKSATCSTDKSALTARPEGSAKPPAIAVIVPLGVSCRILPPLMPTVR